jgi:hypothetical protein
VQCNDELTCKNEIVEYTCVRCVSVSVKTFEPHIKKCHK